MSLEIHFGGLEGFTVLKPHFDKLHKSNGFAVGAFWLRWGMTIIGINQ